MRATKILIKYGILVALFCTDTIYTYTQYAYAVCNPSTTTCTLNIINCTTNSVIQTLNVGSGPGYQIVVTPNGRYAYISAYNSSPAVNAVYVMDITTNSLVTTITSGIPTGAFALAMAPDGSYVYVAGNAGTIALSVISTSSNTVTSGPTALPATPPGIYNPSFIAINPAGTLACIADGGSRNALPITIGPGGVPTLGSVFTVGMSGNGLTATFAPNGTLYVESNTFLYPVTFSGSTPTVGGVIANLFGGPGGQIAISSNSNTAYVAGTTGELVSIVNIPAKNFITDTVGNNPEYLALTPDGNYVYISNSAENTNSISVLSTATNTITATITLPTTHGTGPQGIAIVSKSSGPLDTSFGTKGITLTPISRADILKATAITTVSPIDKIIISGITQTTAPTAFLAQYTSNGFLDTSSFNSSGSTPGYQTLLPGTATQSSANCVTLDASSNILIAGSAIQSSNSDFLVARYQSTGLLDSSFNTTNGGWVTTPIGSGATANGIGIQSSAQSNRIIVGGCSVQNGNPVFTLAGYLSSGGSAGTLDTSFGTASSGIVTTSIGGNIAILRALAIVPSTLNGATIDYITAAGVVDNHITLARYTSLGALDTSFNSTGIFQPTISGASSSQAYNMQIDATTNNIYVVGSAMISGVNQSLLLRCLPTGALDTSFNSTGYVLQPILYSSEYYALILQTIPPINNNCIVTGGYAEGALSNEISLARYTPSGALDLYFNNNSIYLAAFGTFVSAANALGIQSTGNSIVAGTADGTFYVSRFLE